MWADGGVEAIVGDDEALDGASGDQVLTDDFRHVVDGDAAVPDGFRVDDDGGAVLALVETSSLVGADGAGKAGAADCVLEGGVELAFAVGGAGGAGAAGFAEISADEDVAFKFRQSGGSFWVGILF